MLHSRPRCMPAVASVQGRHCLSELRGMDGHEDSGAESSSSTPFLGAVSKRPFGAPTFSTPIRASPPTSPRSEIQGAHPHLEQPS